MDSSSKRIMCGDWGVLEGVIIDGRPEVLDMVVDLVDIVSM